MLSSCAGHALPLIEHGIACHSPGPARSTRKAGANVHCAVGSWGGRCPSLEGHVTGTGAPGGSVTATWSGIASPSGTDWIGLYAPGASNTAYLAWIYVSCSQTAGSAKAAGACALGIPGTLTPGACELRLFANNGYTRLTTSNGLTVN